MKSDGREENYLSARVVHCAAEETDLTSALNLKLIIFIMHS